ncbi:hypothetical protein RJT34_04841 [Clitoria ternatea]|uniref:Uncharacterized protein n=1 Tax=Clitoria ternatea TaxID=43366 RepID=A0AAN9KPT0_CLITE
MDNLKLLNFCDSDKIHDSKLRILSSFESLPDELRFLCWDSFPQRSLPLDFDPENLVELYMCNFKLEIFLERDQVLRMVVSTYQVASGAGAAAMEELELQISL